MSNNATRYLQRLGQSWYVRVKVPAKLQEIVGNTHIRKALGTRDLDKANELKWAQVKAIKAYLTRLSRAPVPPGKVDPLHAEAKHYRTAIMEARSAEDDDSAEAAQFLAVDRAKEIERTTGDERRAVEWYQLATAETPLLTELFDTWIKGENYKEQTKKQHRAALDNLLAFLKGDKLPAAVTADVATDFVEDWLKKSGQSYNTQRRKLNSLVSFWKWLGLRRYVERGFNPWTGFQLSKSRTPKKTPDKRPYSEAELLQLFAKRPTYEGLADVMVLGLYTGARIEELCALRMRDICVRGDACFVTLRTGKGTTKIRTIAVMHAHPTDVINRRWRNNADQEAQLFPEFKPGGYDGKLSWAVSKAFGRFRDAAGLTREVDFHSFRRTLTTALENIGVDQAAMARYVGHALPTLAFTVYSGGSTEKTNRDVAARIRYSREVEDAVEQFLAQRDAAQQAAA